MRRWNNTADREGKPAFMKLSNTTNGLVTNNDGSSIVEERLQIGAA
ncbi:MAG TPA: hypothetical protein VF609_00455 [Flavisolibacter sp.]